MELVGTGKPKDWEDAAVKYDDIGERMWPYLGADARKLLNTGISHTVLQFDRGEDGEIYQLRPIWAPSERPKQKYTREVHTMYILMKMVKFDTIPEKMPDDWVRRFALVIDKLVEADKLSYGIVGPPVAMPLAMATLEYQMVMMLHCFSDVYRMKELNDFLGNHAFIHEGDVGNDDWSGLPE